MLDLPLVLKAGVSVVFLASLAGVWYLDRPAGAWGQRLRSRFVMGVPWGTLVSMGLVVSVYLFVQQGAAALYDPLTIPFASWSYLYPTGWVFAPFSHRGFGHLFGNMVGTVALAPLAEYAWSHFPTRRGSSSFSSWRTHPYVRAFVLFPLGVVAVGLASSVFSWGPVIGFSGVVFAFAGFALVRYPLGAVVALTGQQVVRLTYDALRDPILVQEASETFARPWWFGIAVQGHLLGLLLGVVVGVAVLGGREERPSALRLWTGTLLVATSLNVWALWWYRGAERYVLYRGLGLALVVSLALLVAVGLRSSDRRLLSARGVDLLGVGFGGLLVLAGLSPLALQAVGPALGVDPVPVPVAGLALVVAGGLVVAGVALLDLAADRSLNAPVSRRQAATALLLLPLLTMAVVAVPINLSTVAAGDAAGDAAVEVRDYTVTYVEDVPNRKVSAVDVSLFGESTQVNTSGVVVVSEARHVWSREVSTGELAFAGTRHVKVGGLGWSETVGVRREGWSAAGGPTAYHVWLNPPDGDYRHAFASDPANASPVLAGKNVSVVPARQHFFLSVSAGNETLTRVLVPPDNGTATAAGIRFVRRGDRVFATFNGTRVQVASRETYD